MLKADGKRDEKFLQIPLSLQDMEGRMVLKKLGC
jgi:hypothetical protein